MVALLAEENRVMMMKPTDMDDLTKEWWKIRRMRVMERWRKRSAAARDAAGAGGGGHAGGDGEWGGGGAIWCKTFYKSMLLSILSWTAMLCTIYSLFAIYKPIYILFKAYELKKIAKMFYGLTRCRAEQIL